LVRICDSLPFTEISRYFEDPVAAPPDVSERTRADRDRPQATVPIGP
jgi:hypothetical protein